ncbi:MAG: DUF4492 domain-containing protein [Muribaculaceae bacterium]|nr:DUF4492 domain-containing protein [Muribaculaceae bacterium]
MAQRKGFWARAVDLYVDGFRSMTVGKTLWLIIAIKIFVFFVIIKILFFPNFLASKSDSDEGKAQYVREQLIDNSKN